MKHSMGFVAVAVALCANLTAPSVGLAASFDCGKASQRVEKLICADSNLSKLDEDLAAEYRARGDSAPAALAQMRLAQRQWLASRNVCSDATCVRGAYERRLSELRAATEAKPDLSRKSATDSARQPMPVVEGDAPPESSGLASLGVRALKSLEFKSFDGQVRLDAGRVVFSNYDSGGNNQNIIALNIAVASARNLAEGIYGGAFVAEDDRFLVYSASAPNAKPLIVIDKRTGKRTGSVRLYNDIAWGYILGDRLYLVQAGLFGDTGKATALIYHLPALKFERSVEITGGRYTTLWNDKIVSMGRQLAIYDLELRQIAVVNMPDPDPNLHASCGGGPLSIYGNKAVVGATCAQLAVVDLPSARIERIIGTGSFFQSFTVAEGLIFTVDPDGNVPDVRVIELASGRELARIGIEASYLAVKGKSLLAMKHVGYSAPTKFTWYEVDFAPIRSESRRIARAVQGCRLAEETLSRSRDLHAAIETCERHGIGAFVGGIGLSAELIEVVERYASWLTRSYSRYGEGAEILARLEKIRPSANARAMIALAKRKAEYLDLPVDVARPSSAPEPKGVVRAAIDFGAFSNMTLFDGDAIYIGRWGCGDNGGGGVTLDVLDRKTLRSTHRVFIAGCDDNQQDAISAIAVIPDYIIVGLSYRYDEEGRPTVAVIDTKTMEVVDRGFVKQPIAGLRRWQGRLLACAAPLEERHHRFDPATARYVDVTKDEARACANGDPVPLQAKDLSLIEERNPAIAETAHYRVFEEGSFPSTTYRTTHKQSGASLPIKLQGRGFGGVLAVPDRDALVMLQQDIQHVRFNYYDFETKLQSALIELSKLGRRHTSAIWSHYLFMTLGRDLLVYDIERRVLAAYDKDLIREGFLNNCCGVDRNGIIDLVIDRDRLIVLTFDGANSRVIDLATYTASLGSSEFFGIPAVR